MKIRLNQMLFILLLNYSVTTFAADNDCPSIETVKNIELVSSFQDVSTIWSFSSNYFFENGKKWKVFFSTLLDRDVDVAQIMKIAREEFKNVKLREPQVYVSDKDLCMYDPIPDVVALSYA